MPPSLRGFLQRLRYVGEGFVNAFLRDNRVLPPVLALLALFVFAWIVAGAYIDDEPEQGRVSNQTNVSQTQDAPDQDSVAPEAENRNVDSYAAYRNKDPFRQLLAPAEAQEDSGQDSDTPGDETTASEEPTAPDDDTTTPGGRPRPNGGGGAPDPDDPADRLPDRGPARDPGGGPVGRDPTPDDPGAGRGTPGAGGRDDGGGRPGRNDDLLESGGSLYAPYPER